MSAGARHAPIEQSRRTWRVGDAGTILACSRASDGGCLRATGQQRGSAETRKHRRARIGCESGKSILVGDGLM
jgi:hypothetical protein